MIKVYSMFMETAYRLHAPIFWSQIKKILQLPTCNSKEYSENVLITPEVEASNTKQTRTFIDEDESKEVWDNQILQMVLHLSFEETIVMDTDMIVVTVIC